MFKGSSGRINTAAQENPPPIPFLSHGEQFGTRTFETGGSTLFAFKMDMELELQLAMGTGWHIKDQALVPLVECLKAAILQTLSCFLDYCEHHS